MQTSTSYIWAGIDVDGSTTIIIIMSNKHAFFGGVVDNISISATSFTVNCFVVGLNSSKHYYQERYSKEQDNYNNGNDDQEN